MLTETRTYLARAKSGYRIILCVILGMAVSFTPLVGADVSQPDPTLVNLNVVAVDNHGQSVKGLNPDDFEVTDAGRKQDIVFFRHVDSALRQPPTLGPNEISNRMGAKTPYATVILFDMLNESFGARGYATSQIVDNLQKIENPSYVYLYFLTIDGRLFVVHGLPDNGDASRSASAEPWTHQIRPLLDQSLRSVAQVRPLQDVAMRVGLTFQALEDLAVQLSRVPGRKNIVWVSDGVPIALGPERSDTGDFVDFTPQVRKLGEALARSGVAIYPVRQVIFGDADNIGNVSDTGQTGGEGTGLESEQTLNEFAGMTGGRPNSGKDIAAVVKQAMNDVHDSYQLGYYASQDNWDNKFHKLHVTCKRKGVRIETKTGYYAWSETPGTHVEQAIVSAASPSFDAAEIGMRASVSFDPNDGHAAHFDLHIDASDVAFVRDKDVDGYLAQLRLTVVHYLSDGRTESESIIPLDLHYSSQQRDDALRDGIDYAQDLPVAAVAATNFV